MADLYFYLSSNTPEDDSSTSGGAIDTDMRLIDASSCDSIAGGSGDTIDLVSTSASDTQNVALAGYGTDGSWLTETVSLSGTTNVQSANTYLHLRKVECASSAVGTITVARYNSGSPSSLFTIASGEKGAAGLFLNAQANASGGATKYLYEKIFVYSDADTFTSCIFANTTDEDSELTWAGEEDSGGDLVTNGTESVTNRVTAPTTGAPTFADHLTIGAGLTLGDSGDGNLGNAEAQGIWAKLTLSAGRATEYVVSYTLKVEASSP